MPFGIECFRRITAKRSQRRRGGVLPRHAHVAKVWTGIDLSLVSLRFAQVSSGAPSTSRPGTVQVAMSGNCWGSRSMHTFPSRETASLKLLGWPFRPSLRIRRLGPVGRSVLEKFGPGGSYPFSFFIFILFVYFTRWVSKGFGRGIRRVGALVQICTNIEQDGVWLTVFILPTCQVHCARLLLQF